MQRMAAASRPAHLLTGAGQAALALAAVVLVAT
jgi:hypothetical protein